MMMILLPFAQGDNCCRASRPSGQVFQNGNEFDDKRGQEQNMKTDNPTDQNHRDTINGLVNERPAHRAEEQLQSIRRHGYSQRENHAWPGQRRRAEKGIEFLRKIHGLTKNMNRTKCHEFSAGLTAIWQCSNHNV